MNKLAKSYKTPLATAIAAMLVSWQGMALGQEEAAAPEPVIEEQAAGDGIDEVVVTGRGNTGRAIQLIQLDQVVLAQLQGLHAGP